MYDGKLFVVDKPLKSNIDKEHSKSEKLKIKVLYSRLRRSINHSKMKKLYALPRSRTCTEDGIR